MSDVRELTPCYVAIAQCGCMRAALVDNPWSDWRAHQTYVAKELSEWERDGMTIERRTVKQVREQLSIDCEHRQSDTISRTEQEEGHDNDRSGQCDERPLHFD